MTPTEWNTALLGTGWREAYALVEQHAKAHLIMNVLVGEEVSTAELVEAIYPAAFAKGDGITARKRIFKALEALAQHGLAAYCYKGEPRKAAIGNKMIRPWRWHPPRVMGNHDVSAPRKVCPHCGEEIL